MAHLPTGFRRISLWALSRRSLPAFVSAQEEIKQLSTTSAVKTKHFKSLFAPSQQFILKNLTGYLDFDCVTLDAGAEWPIEPNL